MTLLWSHLSTRNTEAPLKSREQVHFAVRAHLANIEEESLVVKEEEDAWSGVSSIHPCAQHLKWRGQNSKAAARELCV
jgi:hypothetical protein